MTAEQTVLVEIAGRQVEIRRPADGSIVVLARISRGLPQSDVDPAEISEEMRRRVQRSLGTLGKIIEAMIVSEADKDWLDDVMINGEVSPEEAFSIIAKAAKQFNGSDNAPKMPVKAVRRRVR